LNQLQHIAPGLQQTLAFRGAASVNDYRPMDPVETRFSGEMVMHLSDARSRRLIPLFPSSFAGSLMVREGLGVIVRNALFASQCSIAFPRVSLPSNGQGGREHGG
jgi:hypothetical protein